MHLLVDSDSLCYAAGFVANEEGQEALACYQANETIKRILQETQCDSYQLYLSGSNNFRYKIYPQYKANRADMKRPIHLQTIREHLVNEWGATVTDGIEADDAVGIAQCTGAGDTVISHIDKDIDMIPGEHYNPTKKLFYTVSNEQAMRHFFWQILMGDRTDNIPGYDGKMRNKVPKFMEPMMDELSVCWSVEEMLDHIWCIHQADPDDIVRYMHCLWIQRKEEDEWLNYLNVNIMEELGLPVDSILLSRQHFEQPADAGHLNFNV